MKYLKHGLIVIALAASTVFAAAVWQGTTTIEDGQIISASILRDNLDFLYERRLPNCEPGQVLRASDSTGEWECAEDKTIDLSRVSSYEKTACWLNGTHVLSVSCAADEQLLSCAGGAGDLLENEEGEFIRADYPNNTCSLYVKNPGCTPGEDQTGLQRIQAHCVSEGEVSTLGDVPVDATFVSQYQALVQDPAFRAYSNNGSGLNVPSGYVNDQGWYIRGDSNKFRATVDQLCGFFMDNGTYTKNAIGLDYGSDNNNAAYWWNESANRWTVEGHGDNGAIDIVRLDCRGTAVSSAGEFWRIENRPEVCEFSGGASSNDENDSGTMSSNGAGGGGRAPYAGGRCNPYPVPSR